MTFQAAIEQVITVPPDLADALEVDPEALRSFERLTYSQQRRYVLPIEDAKKEDTRARRVRKALAMLRDAQSR